jgi:hypothetical protein
MIILGYSRAAAPVGRITEVGTAVTSFVASGTVGTKASIGLMPGLAVNDVVVGFLSCDNYLQFDSGGGGGFDTSGTWRDIQNPIGTTNILHVAYLRVGATPETAIPVWRATRQQAIVLRAFRGVDTGTLLDGSVAYTYNPSGGSPVRPPAQTTARVNSKRVIVGGIANANTTGFTAPSGFASLQEAQTAASGNLGSALAVALRDESSPGASDPSAFGGVAPDGQWAAVHFSLKAA